MTRHRRSSEPGAKPGADGAAGTTIVGGAGVARQSLSATFNEESSGGGGGVGRIRLNTRSGAADIRGVVSPASSTECMTQGMLASR